jgi:hypothetical protein
MTRKGLFDDGHIYTVTFEVKDHRSKVYVQ